MTTIVVILSALVAALAACNFIVVMWLIRLEGEVREGARWDRVHRANVQNLWTSLMRVGNHVGYSEPALWSREGNDSV